MGWIAKPCGRWPKRDRMPHQPQGRSIALPERFPDERTWQIVETGPDPAAAGGALWRFRARDIQLLARISAPARSIPGRISGFEAFKKTSPTRAYRTCQRERRWRSGSRTKHALARRMATRLWARKGTRPRRPISAITTPMGGRASHESRRDQPPRRPKCGCADGSGRMRCSKSRCRSSCCHRALRN